MNFRFDNCLRYACLEERRWLRSLFDLFVFFTRSIRFTLFVSMPSSSSVFLNTFNALQGILWCTNYSHSMETRGQKIEKKSIVCLALRETIWLDGVQWRHEAEAQAIIICLRRTTPLPDRMWKMMMFTSRSKTQFMSLPYWWLYTCYMNMNMVQATCTRHTYTPTHTILIRASVHSNNNNDFLLSLCVRVCVCMSKYEQNISLWSFYPIGKQFFVCVFFFLFCFHSVEWPSIQSANGKRGLRSFTVFHIFLDEFGFSVVHVPCTLHKQSISHLTLFFLFFFHFAIWFRFTL